MVLAISTNAAVASVASPAPRVALQDVADLDQVLAHAGIDRPEPAATDQLVVEVAEHPLPEVMFFPMCEVAVEPGR